MRNFRVLLLLLFLFPVLTLAQTTPGGGIIFPGSIDVKPEPYTHTPGKSVETSIEVKERYPNLSRLENEVSIIVAHQYAICYPKEKFKNLFELGTTYTNGFISHLAHTLNPKSENSDCTKNPATCMRIENAVERETVNRFVSDSLFRDYLTEKYPKKTQKIKDLTLFLKRISG